MKHEYRVLSQRVGMLRPAEKRFATKKAVDRRVNILTSDKPWEIFTPNKDPDDYFCCSGGMSMQCGCGGITVREYHEEYVKDLPPLILLRVDQREVSDWEQIEHHIQRRPTDES